VARLTATEGLTAVIRFITLSPLALILLVEIYNRVVDFHHGVELRRRLEAWSKQQNPALK
jgi:hypothetical protein